MNAMRNLTPRKTSIFNTQHPEWGSWGVMEDLGGSYVIFNRGWRVLDKWEAEKFWAVLRPTSMLAAN